MKKLLPNQKKVIIDNLLQQKVGIVPTDTVYGLVGLWNNVAVAKKIYCLKERDAHKLLAVLVSDMIMAKKIATISVREQEIYETYPPGKVTLILNQKHQTHKTIAVRITNDLWLKSIIAKTGPLVATSANIQNQPPLTDAKANMLAVDFIVDGGKIDNQASTIIDVTKDVPIIIRE